jgi:hypothetical protein
MIKDQKPLWKTGRKRGTFSREQGTRSMEHGAEGKGQRAMKTR